MLSCSMLAMLAVSRSPVVIDKRHWLLTTSFSMLVVLVRVRGSVPASECVEGLKKAISDAKELSYGAARVRAHLLASTLAERA